MSFIPRLRKTTGWAKGKFCALLDFSVFYSRRMRQKSVALLRSIKTDPPIGDQTIHVLCMAREEYILPAINCLNSFWEFNPEFQAKIWVDRTMLSKVGFILKRIDYPGQVEFENIPDQDREWQWNKMLIITDFMKNQDIFCDADIIWNGRFPQTLKPLLFILERDLNESTAYRYLTKNILNLQAAKLFMFNVSVVKLGRLSLNPDFSARTKILFEAIQSTFDDSTLAKSDVKAIHRMVEQIALSIAVQEFAGDEIDVLKRSDRVMDGGLAESFYFGASHGIL